MDNKSEKKVLLVSQELKLARILADNNKTTRDRAVKNLKKWLTQGTKLMQLTEDDFKRIWKGLFYSMWMSDKLLIQEECAESISSLVHLSSPDMSMLFFKAGLQTLMQEWFGIDQLRLDKFMMLVRRFLRQTLFVLKEQKWKSSCVIKFCDVISSTILNHSTRYPCLGLQMHFIEIFMEEVAKVSEGNLKPETVAKLLKPFTECLATAKDDRLVSHVRKFIFVYLMRQSDLGLEYQEKYEVWKQLGFPGTIDSLRKVKLQEFDETMDDDENEHTSIGEDRPLDPRAGRVDVELPQLKFSPKHVVALLEQYKFQPETTRKTRQTISRLIEQFQKMASGTYPLGTKRLNIKEDTYDTSIKKAVNRLVKFENKITGQKNKKNKHKVKLPVDDDNDDEREEEQSELNVDEIPEHKDNVVQKKKCVKQKMVNGHSSKHEVKEDRLKRKRKLTDVNVHQVKKKKMRKDAGDLEHIFERNSGTWYVYNMSPHSENNCQGNCSIDATFSFQNSMGDIIIQESLKKNDSFNMNNSGLKSPQRIVDCKSQGVQTTNSPRSPVKLFESSSSEDLFGELEWNESVHEEGEYEICFPSRKRAASPKRTVEDTKLVVNKTLNMLRGKNRLSLDPKLLRDPFGKSSTPTGTKKVKINTKLNTSQEIHEHIAGVLKSPGIPFDANKKPEKPLLKTPNKLTSRIDPFYVKQLDDV